MFRLNLILLVTLLMFGINNANSQEVSSTSDLSNTITMPHEQVLSFAKSLIEAGVNQGLTEEEAEKMVLATMCGAQKMLENRGEKSIDDLITAVCSKGGTTIESMKVLNEEKLPFIVDKAVNACVNRVNELEKL